MKLPMTLMIPQLCVSSATSRSEMFNYCVNSISTRWIGTIRFTGIHGSQMYSKFGEPLTFPLTPPGDFWFSMKCLENCLMDCHESCGSFGVLLTFDLAPSTFSNTIVYDQIPAQVMAIPSASAVLYVKC